MKKATTPAAKMSTAAAKMSESDWRDETLSKLRAIVMSCDSEMVEEVKWRKPSNGMKGIPVWSCGGIVCTGETYKTYVKMTFAKGASIDDPSGIFNSSLEGNARRAIDFHEGAKIDEKGLKSLIRAAVALNVSDKPKTSAKPAAKKPKKG